MKNLLIFVSYLFLALFLVYPLLWLLPQGLLVNGRFSLSIFSSVLCNSLVLRSLFNSLLLAVFTLAGTTLVGIPLALLLTRYSFPGANFYRLVFILPVIISPFVGAIGMQQFLARFGSLNLLLLRLRIMHTPIPWLGSGLLGIAILQILHLYPIMYLNISAAMANFDRSCEEASASLGASPWQTFRHISFPLLRPGYFAASAIIFIWSLTDLGTPLVFEYTQLLPVQIFNALKDVNINPAGYSLVLIVLLLSSVLFLLTKKTVERSIYTTGRTPFPLTKEVLSGTKRLAVCFVLFFLAAVSLLPHLSVILSSFAQRWFFSILPSDYSFRHYLKVLNHPLTRTGIINSLFFSILATGVDIIFGLTIGFLLIRHQFRSKSLLDTLAMTPLAIPGIALGFSYCTAFSRTWVDPRKNPVVLLVAAYAVRRLPYLVRSACASFQQLNEQLEEASASLGAKPRTTFRQIVLPLITPGLISGGIMVFAFSMLEVSSSLVLAFQEKFFPLAKVIYSLAGRLTDGPGIASALGVLGMILLALCLFLTSRFGGRQIRDFFRTG